MERTYNDAVAALNSLQTNAAVINSIRKSGKSLNIQAIPEMIEWCNRAGYQPAEFDRLRPIHVAGTKGKGSTSAIVSSILTQYLPSPSQPKPLFRKIGLYTSPHLRFVRERIQINNEPLSEALFAQYFFETWDRLEESARVKGEEEEEEPTGKTAKPSYFRFLTLMAFHTYLREGVDTAIIECGVGGEFDSTNIITSPSVTGITSLGIDHVQLLGNTIEEIAWHKAGIMKTGIPSYTVPQLPAAEKVLFQRAAEKSVNLTKVPEHPQLQTVQLGLEAPFQRTNASLAIALASAHLETLPNNRRPPPLPSSPSTLPPEFIRGLEQVRWSGRCEIRREGRSLAWHIDSAHTLESIRLAASWFASQTSPRPPLQQQQQRPPTVLPSSSVLPSQRRDHHHHHPQTPTRILLFNQQTRDAPALALALHSTLSAALETPQPFTHAVFCTNLTFKESGYRPDLVSINTDRRKVEALEVQRGLRDTWLGLDGEEETVVEVKGSIEEAVEWARGVAKTAEAGKGDEVAGESGGGVKVLVTGSVHLVGGFLEVLESGVEKG
ncbi:MAG: hypothetical protein Q9219_006634 [cf. Caloplaca sp. 3 TL-2023]